MRRTLFLSETKESTGARRYEAPYIFYDRKWKEDTWYFDSVDEVRKLAKKRGYIIK